MSGTDEQQQKSNSQKILWLSIIQGYAILLVLIGHVNGYTYNEPDELYPLSDFIHRLSSSFHMPLFMFVSGGLLYFSRISKNWSTGKLYKDKARRLLLPFIFFTIVGFVAKIPFMSVAKTAHDMSFYGFLNAFFSPIQGPLKEMWFVGTLMWLMALYPVYKSMLKNPFTEIMLLVITLIPFIDGVKPNIDGWFHLSGVFSYAFYFVAGMLFFKYNMTALFEKSKAAVVCVTVCYLCLFFLDIESLKLLTVVTGLLATFGIGVHVAKRFPHLFSSFRDHSFQIFLVGIFPQMIIELLVWRHVHAAGMQLPYFIVSVSLALFTGVLVSKIGQRLSSKYLRWCLGLK